MAALLQVSGLRKHFGGFVALAGVDLAVAEGERLGLIGPNGSGKTTLISCVAGSLFNDAGSIRFAGEEISRKTPHQRTRLGIARSFQIPRPFISMTVLENLMVPFDWVARAHDRARAHERPNRSATDEAMAILAQMGLTDKAQVQSNQLSQVELRKMELARAMAARPRLLISDEAMAGLAGAEVDEVLAILFKLNEGGITVVMIEHIMQAVMKFSQRVVCLDTGQVICEGTPGEVVADPGVQRAYLGD